MSLAIGLLRLAIFVKGWRRETDLSQQAAFVRLSALSVD
jgi:hypothetical protein